MNRMVLHSRVGPDGMLHITVAIGKAAADQEVRVIIEPAAVPATQEEWQEFVKRTAGSVTDPTFRRHDQGELENREPLS